MREPRADDVARHLASVEVAAVAAVSRVETRAALARARRGRRLTARQEALAWTRFGAIWSTSAVITVDEVTLDGAVRIAAEHGLRGYAAIQLAAAVEAAGATGSSRFACLDEELNAAARREGLDPLLSP